MSEELEKAKALLDAEEGAAAEEETGKEAQEETAGAQGAKEKKSAAEMGQELRELCRGKRELLVPFRAHGQDVKEMEYDFFSMTGMEMLDALDSDMVNNVLAISNKQALAIFAAAAAKRAPVIEENGFKTRLYDAKDVRERLSPADCVAAIRIAKLFYQASGQTGSNYTSKE